jgi:DNA repair exonuclease SbcCD nuclease subunit
MSQRKIRILFVADTHLGFDLPFRPRIQRRRRGHDFFENFKRALQPAMKEEVDLVLHGGDLFYRSRVPDALVDMAFAPLVDVADKGIPVYLVPGNHERSKIPLHLWSAHPNLHIFTEPKTYLQEIDGMRLALSGFPFARNIRDKFCELVSGTAYGDIDSDIRILCMHQTVEGAQVGPSNYTFRSGPDIIKGSDIPGDFSVALSGHIHRAQMLSSDLKRMRLKAPVIYPGSVERTSFAERNEEKQYVIVEVLQDDSSIGILEKVTFIGLPARPMLTIEVEVDGKSVKEVNRLLEHHLSEIDPDSVVRIKPLGQMAKDVRWLISAQHLRTIAPESMNVSVSPPRDEVSYRKR